MLEIALLILAAAAFAWWSIRCLTRQEAQPTPNDTAQARVDRIADPHQRIMEAGGLAEQRRNGRCLEGGRVYINGIDDDDPALDKYHVRPVLRSLRKEGWKSDVYVK